MQPGMSRLVYYYACSVLTKFGKWNVKPRKLYFFAFFVTKLRVSFLTGLNFVIRQSIALRMQSGLFRLIYYNNRCLLTKPRNLENETLNLVTTNTFVILRSNRIRWRHQQVSISKQKQTLWNISGIIYIDFSFFCFSSITRNYEKSTYEVFKLQRRYRLALPCSPLICPQRAAKSAHGLPPRSSLCRGERSHDSTYRLTHEA